MPRPKPKFEDHSHYFKTAKITLPDEATYNSNTLITITCEKSHTYKLSVNNIRNQNKDPLYCPHCNHTSENQGHFTQGIPESVIQNYCKTFNLDYEPKQDFYSRWRDQITFICKNDGYKHIVKSLNHWESNTKDFHCPECIMKERGLISQHTYNEKLLNLEKIVTTNDTEKLPSIELELLPEKLKENILSQEKWSLVEFINTRTKCKYQCNDCGNLKECYPHTIFNGRGGGCDHCKKNGNRKNIYQKMIQICKDANVFPVEDVPYKDVETPITYKCNICGTQFQKAWNRTVGYMKINCPSCYKSTKRGAQNDLFEWITTITNDVVIQEDRSTGIELDIFIPSKRLAIEYCGLVWHSTRFKSDINAHQQKLEKCNSSDIRLLTIFEDEWIEKRDICKSRIQNALGLTQNKIFARKCSVEIVENSKALEFCEKNHIQGKGQTNKSYGLFFENELVSVMTFSKPSIAKGGTDYDWELNRFCSKLGVAIVGGANKLLQRFRKENPGKKLVTFCDLRWGTGNVYEKMDFTYLSTTRPNYYYFGKHTHWKRKHRFGFTKQSLKTLLNITTDEYTETELSKMAELYRIYDCGHKKFILTT